MRTRFGESSCRHIRRNRCGSAGRRGVQRDSAHDDVPARLFPGELDLVEHLRLDEGELVPATGGVEGAASCGVSIAGEALPGSASTASTRGSRASAWGGQDRRDRADAGCCAVRPVGRQVEVGAPPASSLRRSVRPCRRRSRVEPDTGRRSEHHEGVLAVAVTDDGDPLPGQSNAQARRSGRGRGCVPRATAGRSASGRRPRRLRHGAAQDLAEAAGGLGRESHP